MVIGVTCANWVNYSLPLVWALRNRTRSLAFWNVLKVARVKAMIHRHASVCTAVPVSVTYNENWKIIHFFLRIRTQHRAVYQSNQSESSFFVPMTSLQLFRNCVYVTGLRNGVLIRTVWWTRSIEVDALPKCFIQGGKILKKKILFFCFNASSEIIL